MWKTSAEIVKAMPDLVLIMNAKGEYSNPLTEEFVQPDSLQWGSKVHDKLRECMGQALTNNSPPVHYEFNVEGVSLEARVSKISETQVIILLRDVTVVKAQQHKLEEDLKRTNDELRRSNEELKQFAYAASHDLREPLLKIASFGERLRSKAKMTPKEQEYLQIMLSAAGRMTRLIDDLLAYSRVGRKEDPQKVTDSGLIWRQSLEILSLQVEKSQPTFHVPNTWPELWVDANQICLLFQNLLSNSLKFYKPDEHPVVTLSYTVEESKVHFIFQDQGIGFEPEHSERIFQAFERLHSRFEYPGTGIGLALCRRIVERHCGKIWAEGVPGKGASFHFTLPLAEKV